MGAGEQTRLAQIVVRLAEDIGGAVVVVDHSRKNRPDGQAVSSADILGPSQKWQASEHIVMLDTTGDSRRLELFIEGKDVDGARFFLTVSPKGTTDREKFTYAGTVAEIADAQRAKGDHNREAVLRVVKAAAVALPKADVVKQVKAAGYNLAPDTVGSHLAALVKAKKVRTTGEGRSTRYFALDIAVSPSTEKPLAENESAYAAQS